MTAEIASIIAPLFICAGIGYFWERRGPPFESTSVTALALTLGMPCLIFSTLTKLEVSPEAFAEMSGAFGLAILGFLATGVVVLKVSRLPLSTYLPTFTASNTGNMGLPLSLFAFGETGLAFAICIYVISSVFSFVVGWSIYAGRLGIDVLYNNPLLYAVGAALICVIWDIRPPQWLANTTELLGALTIPLTIIALGVSIAKLKISGFWRTLTLSAIKLASGFAVGVLIADLLGLTGVPKGVLIIQCAMPIAVHNYVFALRFQRGPEETASMIILSTLISMATLPLLLWYVL